MSAEWVHCFEMVLEALKVRLEVMSPVLWIPKGESFVVYHNLLGGCLILATMAHNSENLGLHQSLVPILLLGWIGQGGRTGQRLEMVVAKAGNYTLVVDNSDSFVAQIECLCSLYCQYYCVMLTNCPLGIIVSETAHLLEPYWLSLVQICSLRSYVNKWWW